MNKQITFYGDYCESSAIKWLEHLENCFEIVNASLKVYTIDKGYWAGKQKRCKIKVRYK